MAFDVTQVGVKKCSCNQDDDRVAIDQMQAQIEPNFSPLCCKIEVETQFGSCEYIIDQDRIRNLESMFSLEISKYESVSLAIRKSVKRGIALAKQAQNKPLIQKVFELASLCLKAAEKDEVTKILPQVVEHILCEKTICKVVETSAENLNMQLALNSDLHEQNERFNYLRGDS